MSTTIHVGPSSEQFPSLSLALEDPGATEIIIAPGRYVEHVVIAPRRGPLTIRSSTGRAEDVVITFGLRQGDRNATGMPYVQDCATFTIDADDVTLDAITIENSFDKGTAADVPDSQAIALRTRGTDLLVKGCRLLGRQDTVLLDAPSWAAIRRVHLLDCEVVGDVDFIYGRATALIEGGEVRSCGPGYVAAPSTARENPRGFLFHGVRFTAEEQVVDASVHLGRPWHPGGKPDAIGQAVVAHCELGPHITRTPWSDMGGFAWQDARLAESGNSGPGAHGVGPQLARAPDPRSWLPAPAPEPGQKPKLHVVTGPGISRGWSLPDSLESSAVRHRVSLDSLAVTIDEASLDGLLEAVRAGDVVILETGSNGCAGAVFTRIPASLRRLLAGIRARGATPVLAAPGDAAPGRDDGMRELVRSLARFEEVEIVEEAGQIREIPELRHFSD